MSKRTVILFALVGALAGCRFGQLPNPEEKVQSKFNGEALQNDVRKVNEVLTERLVKGEIDEGKKTQLLQDYIREQLQDVDPSEVPGKQAWRFADVYRLLGDWKTTNDLYERAVQDAADEDRRVNDTLRLAEAKAKLDDVEKGIALVRSTFDAAPGGKAPILLATLYEFVPAALEQGHDLEVAKLLEDAMDQHLMTYVDPDTEVGKAFLIARPHHIRQGWEFVLRIYRDAGDEQTMRRAIERADAMMRRFAIA